MSVAALGSHRYGPKCLELFPSVHGWHSSSALSLLSLAEKVLRGQMMASHPKVPTSLPFHFFILRSSSAKFLSFLPWTSIWGFLTQVSSAGNSPVSLLFLRQTVTSFYIGMAFTTKLLGMEPVMILPFKYNSCRLTKSDKDGRGFVSFPESESLFWMKRYRSWLR